jgi:transcriptional regulator with XRE-family HTH domain
MSEAELRKRFGDRVYLLRRHRDLTQDQLAESGELTARFIRTIESGKAAPSFKTLVKLAKALDTQVVELFRFDETTPPREKAAQVNLPKEFGKRVQLLRIHRNIKPQKQLAIMIGVKPHFLSTVEGGKSPVSFDTIARLTEALNVEAIDLFCFDGPLPK